MSGIGDYVDPVVEAMRQRFATVASVTLHTTLGGRRRALVKHGDNWWCARRGTTYEEALERLRDAIVRGEGREGWEGEEQACEPGFPL